MREQERTFDTPISQYQHPKQKYGIENEAKSILPCRTDLAFNDMERTVRANLGARWSTIYFLQKQLNPADMRDRGIALAFFFFFASNAKFCEREKTTAFFFLLVAI